MISARALSLANIEMTLSENHVSKVNIQIDTGKVFSNKCVCVLWMRCTICIAIICMRLIAAAAKTKNMQTIKSIANCTFFFECGPIKIANVTLKYVCRPNGWREINWLKFSRRVRRRRAPNNFTAICRLCIFIKNPKEICVHFFSVCSTTCFRACFVRSVHIRVITSKRKNMDLDPAHEMGKRQRRGRDEGKGGGGGGRIASKRCRLSINTLNK